MIEIYLIVFIVALVVANIFIAAAKPKRKSTAPMDSDLDDTGGYSVQTEIVNALESIDQKHSATQGAISATQQKLNILNDRLASVEKAVTGIIENKVNAPDKQASSASQNGVENGYDFEKLEFRLKVLESGLEELRKPRVFPKTFYGKVDPDMEKEVRSLVFNTKRKV